MNLILGKNTISELTSKIDVYAPAGNGRKKKAGSLNVTVQVLPRSEFEALADSCENDKEIARALVRNIEAGDAATQVAEYTPDMMDDIFEIDWQFYPIFEFVLTANNERLGKALKAKN